MTSSLLPRLVLRTACCSTRASLVTSKPTLSPRSFSRSPAAYLSLSSLFQQQADKSPAPAPTVTAEVAAGTGPKAPAAAEEEAYHVEDVTEEEAASMVPPEAFKDYTEPEGITYPYKVYSGPVAVGFFRLKAFSLSSLVLSTALSPLILVLEAEIGLAARIVLAGTAISTTIVSTALISWCSTPYVHTIEVLEPASRANPAPAIRLLTYNWRLQARRTTITTPLFIHESQRPLTTWELRPLAIPPSEPYPDIVAQTEDKTGKILGRWDGEHEEGDTQKLFFVAEDLLEGKYGMDKWRRRKGSDFAP